MEKYKKSWAKQKMNWIRLFQSFNYLTQKGIIQSI